MWRRVCSQLAPWRYAAPTGATLRNRAAAAAFFSSSPSPSSFKKTAPFFSADSVNAALEKRAEEVMPIATGNERHEIEAELEGKKFFVDMETPVGPFGTKEAPAVIQSCYDRRIVGCSGGEGEDEHDVVWFWLKNGRPHECPVCSQYFVLEVTGAGGEPKAHSDADDH